MSKTNETILIKVAKHEKTSFVTWGTTLEAMSAARKNERERIRKILSKNFNECVIHPGATYVRNAILKTLNELK